MSTYQTTSTALKSNLIIPFGEESITGTLSQCSNSNSLVCLINEKGNSRYDPVDFRVATAMNDAGISTLLLDLDDPTQQHRALDFYAERLVQTTLHLLASTDARNLKVGFFASGKSAASAVQAAACIPSSVRALVSVGGRPDLAGSSLGSLQAPLLLIVSQDAPQNLWLNKRVMTDLKCENALAVLPNAGERFTKRGAMEQVARLAKDWFAVHLR